MELGLEVNQYLYLLALVVECVTHCCILGAYVLAERNISCSGTFHIGSTLHEAGYIEACNGNGKQSHGSEYAEAATHIVGDDE